LEKNLLVRAASAKPVEWDQLRLAEVTRSKPILAMNYRLKPKMSEQEQHMQDDAAYREWRDDGEIKLKSTESAWHAALNWERRRILRALVPTPKPGSYKTFHFRPGSMRGSD